MAIPVLRWRCGITLDAHGSRSWPRLHDLRRRRGALATTATSQAWSSSSLRASTAPVRSDGPATYGSALWHRPASARHGCRPAVRRDQSDTATGECRDTCLGGHGRAVHLDEERFNRHTGGTLRPTSGATTVAYAPCPTSARMAPRRRVVAPADPWRIDKTLPRVTVAVETHGQAAVAGRRRLYEDDGSRDWLDTPLSAREVPQGSIELRYVPPPRPPPPPTTAPSHGGSQRRHPLAAAASALATAVAMPATALALAAAAQAARLLRSMLVRRFATQTSSLVI